MKSSPAEIATAEELVEKTWDHATALLREGKRIHIIWDFDFVLASGLSDDVFILLGHDLEKFFEYERRLCLECPDSHIWMTFAAQLRFLPGVSQDIVTARSTDLRIIH